MDAAALADLRHRMAYLPVTVTLALEEFKLTYCSNK